MWYNRRDLQKHQGLLWIKGKPGSGKSTLIKEAMRQARKSTSPHNQHIVSFFFNARGHLLEKTPVGFFRVLLYQLLPVFREQMHEFVEFCNLKIAETDEVEWDPQELKNNLRSTLSEPCGLQIFVFVDALDECVNDGSREIMNFLRELSADAYSTGHELNICVSSRHYPTITIATYFELVLEDYNEADIALFVDRKLSMAGRDTQTQTDSSGQRHRR